MAKRSTIGENPLDAVIRENPLDTVVPDLSVVTKAGRMAAPELAALGPVPRGPSTSASASERFCTVKFTSPSVTKMR